jgi:hypothetical protein
VKGSTTVGVLMLAVVVLVVVCRSPTWRGSNATDTTHGASIGITASKPSHAPTPAPRPVPRPSAEAWDVAQAAAGHVAIIGWLVALAVLPFFALVAVALYGRHRGRLLEPDRPPLRDREAVQRIYDVRSLEARRGWLPESFTYSPRYTHRGSELELEDQALTRPMLGGIEELLNHGQGLAYGWRADNGELLVDRQVRSLLVGGVQGSGKTSFVALLVAQLVRMGARVMLADPDALNQEGLASRLAVLGIQPEATAYEPAAVLRIILDAKRELMSRRDQGLRADTRPYVVVVDELPECLRVLNRRDTDELRDALELIGGFKGRKHSVVTIMLAQSWTQAVIGSTTMRNLIPASAVFQQRSEEAEKMCGIKPGYWRTVGPDPFDLEKGTFYAVGIDSGAVRVRVPEVPSHSLPPLPRARAREVSGLSGELNRSVHQGVAEVSSGALPDTPRTPLGQSNGHHADTSLDSPADTYGERVLELFREGRTINTITREVERVEPGGRAWQEARQRVEAAVRRGLR